MAKTAGKYISGLIGWQQVLVSQLRADILSASPDVSEAFKWAQPVYSSGGPVCYLKAHKHHVTFGFWRGAELMALNSRLTTSGSKMAHMKLTDGDTIDAAEVAMLVRAGAKLNAELGDPNKRR